MRADFTLDYNVLTVERPQKLYLLARFESGDSPGDQTRRPLNLSLVIDRSGSMAGDKIDYTRQAGQFLVQHLGVRDTLSIVLYNDQVETLLFPENVTNKDEINQLLDRIRVRGTTNLSGGWLEGCQHVASNLSSNNLNRVILMTDGLANRGVTDTSTLVTMAKQKREAGVTTTTMGLGNDFNEDLLMEMANAGGGAFYFIESPEVTPEIFKEELSGLLTIVGQNLTITFSPTQHVKALTQLNAYPMSTDGKQTIFRLGDIFGNEVKMLLLEISIPALDTIGEAQIATLRFEYDELTSDKTNHQVKEFPVMVNVKSAQEPLPLPHPEVTQSVLLLKAAQARQNAVKAADKGDYSSASKALHEVADAIENASVKSEALSDEKVALREQAKKMERGAQDYDEYSRKSMSTQAFYTMTSRHSETMVLRKREQTRSQSESPAEQKPEPAEGAKVNVEGESGTKAKPNPQATLDREIPAVQTDESSQAIPKQSGVSPTHLVWKEKLFALKGDIIRLGRASHNEIIIDEKGVSRFHSQIRRVGDKLLIEDLGSTNGTMIEGKLISEAFELSVGDVVFLCDEKLVFTRQSN